MIRTRGGDARRPQARRAGGMPPGRAAAGALILAGAAWCGPARAQGPQFDVGQPPGAAGRGANLGPPVGASGAVDIDASTGGQPLSGRPGPTASHVFANQVTGPPTSTTQFVTARFRQVQAVPPPAVPSYGTLDLPIGGAAEVGPADGLTLDQAIDLLLRNNLNILALKYEIDMAKADVLTASLRVNPVFYADSQLIPYGQYSQARSGGPTQYDVNINYPLDVTQKRKNRTIVAKAAMRVTEAQFQDSVRNQVDALYAAYVNAVAAQQTLEFSRVFLGGITGRLRLESARLEKGETTPATVDAIRAQVEQAQLQIREAEGAVLASSRSLALLLNVPRQQAAAVRVRGALRDVSPLPMGPDQLVASALANRPDLNAYRLGLKRAEADFGLARANRYTDVYVLAQPYTFQNNQPYGLKSAYSYSVGVTANLPIYNRNQGNIKRAQLNITQTRIELEAQERQVVQDVDAAVLEFDISLNSVLETEREVLPAQRRVRDSAEKQFKGGEIPLQDFLEAQKDYNDAVRQYRDALVRHRNAMLDLNTAVGSRVMP